MTNTNHTSRIQPGMTNTKHTSTIGVTKHIKKTCRIQPGIFNNEHLSHEKTQAHTNEVQPGIKRNNKKQTNHTNIGYNQS